jgi:hypothetical protein
VLDFLGALADAMRNEYRRGRKHSDVAREVHVSPRTIGAIVLEDRRIGRQTANAIFAARPAWLLPLLLQVLHEYCEDQLVLVPRWVVPGWAQDEASYSQPAAGGDGRLQRKRIVID